MFLYCLSDEDCHKDENGPNTFIVYVVAENDQKARELVAKKRGTNWLDPRRCVIEECWDISKEQELYVNVQYYCSECGCKKKKEKW